MKKQLSLITVFVFSCVWSVNAQLFWEISGNGLVKTSYLFGTHHLIESDQIKNFDQILARCSQADAVVGEIDLSDVNLQSKVMQGATMTDQTIRDLLSPEDYTFIDNEFKRLLGVGMDRLGKMKPMMLNSVFGITSYLKEYDIAKQPESVDQILQKHAAGNNKKVIGLETADDQVNALFNSLSLKRQAEILVKDVKESQKGIEILKRLNQVYLSGDLTAIEALNKEDDSMTQEEKKFIEDNRNLNWMAKLPALLNEQCCFIAVGCLHLTGETGLINQLRKAGYSVNPVVL